MPVPVIWAFAASVAILAVAIATKDEVEFESPYFKARGRNY